MNLSTHRLPICFSGSASKQTTLPSKLHHPQKEFVGMFRYQSHKQTSFFGFVQFCTNQRWMGVQGIPAVVVTLLFFSLGCSAPISPPKNVEGSEKKSYDNSVSVAATEICPTGFPVNCSDWCCPTGTQCDPLGPVGKKCSYPSPANRADGVEEQCPSNIPIDCGTFCCPEGTVCAPDSPEEQQCRTVVIPPPILCLKDADCDSQQICVLTDKGISECANLCQSDTDCHGLCCWATDDPEVGACGPCK